jgi:hypothetical protein
MNSLRLCPIENRRLVVWRNYLDVSVEPACPIYRLNKCKYIPLKYGKLPNRLHGLAFHTIGTSPVGPISIVLSCGIMINRPKCGITETLLGACIQV